MCDEFSPELHICHDGGSNLAMLTTCRLRNVIKNFKFTDPSSNSPLGNLDSFSNLSVGFDSGSIGIALFIISSLKAFVLFIVRLS